MEIDQNYSEDDDCYRDRYQEYVTAYNDFVGEEHISYFAEASNQWSYGGLGAAYSIEWAIKQFY